jgi:hypothetical protein
VRYVADFFTRPRAFASTESSRSAQLGHALAAPCLIHVVAGCLGNCQDELARIGIAVFQRVLSATSTPGASNRQHVEPGIW